MTSGRWPIYKEFSNIFGGSLFNNVNPGHNFPTSQVIYICVMASSLSFLMRLLCVSLCVPVSISISYNVFFLLYFSVWLFCLGPICFWVIVFYYYSLYTCLFFKERQKGWNGRWEVTKKRGVKGGKIQIRIYSMRTF